MSWEPLDDAAERTTDEVALFHRTLAELCRADVPLGRALRVTRQQVEHKPLAEAVGRMADRVEQGESLAVAYGVEDAVFDPAYRRLLVASEAAGDVPGALEEIAHHAAQHAATTQRLRRAIAYPLATACFVLLICGATVAFLSPTLFAYTTAVSGASPMGFIACVLGLLACIVGITFYVGWLRSGPPGTRTLGLPLTGAIRRNAVRARVAGTLSMLLGRQVPLHEAFALAADTTGNLDMARRLTAAATSTAEGEGLVGALREGNVVEPALLWLVEAGEHGGEAGTALADIASIYRQRLSRGLDRFGVLVRPTAELVVGVFVFALAYAFLVPVYDHIFNLI